MKVLEELGIQNREEVYERWVRYVNEYEERAILYDGFEEVLESFKRAGVIQAIVASETKNDYQEDVVSQGIDSYMAAAVLANDTKKHKPDPEPLLECLRRLDFSPKMPSTSATPSPIIRLPGMLLWISDTRSGEAYAGTESTILIISSGNQKNCSPFFHKIPKEFPLRKMAHTHFSQCAPFFLFYSHLIQMPDIIHILLDGTVRGELAGFCHV